MIELQQVTKVYFLGQKKVQALSISHLGIKKNEYVAILGPSGSGKTTLMNIIGCLETPTEGQYYFQGQETSQLTRKELARIRNRTIGFVFQGFNLLEQATALSNVTLPLIYGDVPSSERYARAVAMLKKVGLADRLHHRPNQLSGGQCQRVAIARALVMGPQLLLADEPTGNLDNHSSKPIVKLFEGCVTEGKTVIIVTHDRALAKRAQRIVQMVEGKVGEKRLVF